MALSSEVELYKNMSSGMSSSSVDLQVTNLDQNIDQRDMKLTIANIFRGNSFGLLWSTIKLCANFILFFCRTCRRLECVRVFPVWWQHGGKNWNLYEIFLPIFIKYLEIFRHALEFLRIKMRNTPFRSYIVGKLVTNEFWFLIVKTKLTTPWFWGKISKTLLDENSFLPWQNWRKELCNGILSGPK